MILVWIASAWIGVLALVVALRLRATRNDLTPPLRRGMRSAQLHALASRTRARRGALVAAGQRRRAA